MRWILRLVANAVALAIATWILSGISLTGSSTTSKIITLLVVALIFGVLNAIIKPIFALFTAPLILLTLGLFLIVINACMLLLTSWLAGLFDLGWSVDGFWTAVLGAIIISIVSFVLNVFLPDPDDRDVTEESTGRPVRVVFVCLGNICRSPMAERVAERAAADAGVTGVEFASAGTISEEFDDPMDRRRRPYSRSMATGTRITRRVGSPRRRSSQLTSLWRWSPVMCVASWLSRPTVAR
jgi:putative membrane protein